MSNEDLISRQAAIDALKEKEPREVPDTWTDEYAVGKRMQWEKDVKALNSLPSAQPEGLTDDDYEIIRFHYETIMAVLSKLRGENGE